MTTTPPAVPANGGVPTPEEVVAALAAAQAQLHAARSHPAYQGDPAYPIIQALIATVGGLQTLYDGLRTSTRQILTTAQRQQLELATAAHQQREQLNKDFAIQHEAALARVKAEELAQQAHIRAGLVDAAQDALKELLRADRKHTRLRTWAALMVPAVGLLVVGLIIGWYARGADAMTRLTADVHNLAVLTQATQQTSATLQAISGLLTHGMSAAELTSLASLNEVIALNAIGKVPEDTVPSPCIAAVPDGVIRTGTRSIKACVIPIKDNVVVRGGLFLTQAVTGRARN
ncbi:conserved protein of unknown function (plasmid) [Rhodovastum atsumiense]|uniref:Uncharacterized protein n=1 Tax=Rhodovastum atsumiense TaxID=504468 RepID=A0A5M6IK56_9PROT|nr:hypothetical protein [Rhodovastum atsumiense]KAA5608641.1 hypothetical protein F1189_28180 [Rhodovastum atsumiense]CAH2605964.1 conserved protein of unknown function [Rhodovastum atsumiense]